MSPQTTEPQPDELLPTSQASNITRTWRGSKRPIPRDDNESAETTEAALLEELFPVEETLKRINKRFKNSHFVRLDVQSTRSTDPMLAESDGMIQSAHRDSCAGGVGDSSRPMDHAVQASQEPRQDAHQEPRPTLVSLSSSRSNLESHIPTIFSPQPRTLDSQSVYSAQSTHTSYPAGGKSCTTCVNLLQTGFFSTWKKHYWPGHCPQEAFYCLYCKLAIIEDKEQGKVFWQCKKCRVSFQDASAAVAHFTDRNLRCYERHSVWLRIKPFRDHIHHCHIVDLPGTELVMCQLCRETFSKITPCKHECRMLKEWRHPLSTPIDTICEDHGVVLTTFDQVNHHYKVEHFNQAGPRTRRGRTNAGSTIGDDFDSRHDTHSLDAIDPYLSAQLSHGSMITNHAAHTEHEALRHEQIQAERRNCNAVKDPAVDLREMGQKPTLQNLQYPQGGLTFSDETGPSINNVEHLLPPGEIPSGREPPPLLINVVTEGGKAKFLTR